MATEAPPRPKPEELPGLAAAPGVGTAIGVATGAIAWALLAGEAGPWAEDAAALAALSALLAAAPWAGGAGWRP